MDICLESFNYTNNDVVNESKIGSIITKIKEALLSLIGKIKAAFAKIREKLSKKSESEKSTTSSGESEQRRERVHPYHEPKSSGTTSNAKPDTTTAEEPSAAVHEDEPKIQLTAEEEKLLALVPKTRSNKIDLVSETNRRKYVKIMHETNKSEIERRMYDYLNKMDKNRIEIPIDTLSIFHDEYKMISTLLSSLITNVTLVLCEPVLGSEFAERMMKAIIRDTKFLFDTVIKVKFDTNINTYKKAAEALKKYSDELKPETVSYNDIKDSHVWKFVFEYAYSGDDNLKYLGGGGIKDYIYSEDIKTITDVLEKSLGKCEKAVTEIKAKTTDVEPNNEYMNAMYSIASLALHILSQVCASTISYMTISGMIQSAWKSAVIDIYHEKEDSIKEESFNFCSIK